MVSGPCKRCTIAEEMKVPCRNIQAVVFWRSNQKSSDLRPFDSMVWRQEEKNISEKSCTYGTVFRSAPKIQTLLSPSSRVCVASVHNRTTPPPTHPSVNLEAVLGAIALLAAIGPTSVLTDSKTIAIYPSSSVQGCPASRMRHLFHAGDSNEEVLTLLFATNV
ncbi:hypothetical protein PHYSODRAFT_301034 [Phytophthora sojae]|uniref:Uncharacterized protein n=1 Tax=Phytophthora sojae (strain P6497) TaxID=1094619 RepID=G4ZCW1_PHYSP|nr:hypothetical protein PHYSODRAFT_301034 [Phytophthora sojae]EGZ18319.1 hypothetical protein PHYSODRAFT_301034 [Phytophthora sojae]|eukprot:XP_009527377.1 hypothetical protein PHYSODRAFT_301034 [Phytophthora sojae]